ncbi:hypothetical protein BDR05DRAFT_971120 [Suillus weaverae]|nr:hypothetical protein BDR05DRAFT_971120 [Suillus weaverae]
MPSLQRERRVSPPFPNRMPGICETQIDHEDRTGYVREQPKQPPEQGEEHQGSPQIHRPHETPRKLLRRC